MSCCPHAYNKAQSTVHVDRASSLPCTPSLPNRGGLWMFRMLGGPPRPIARRCSGLAMFARVSRKRSALRWASADICLSRPFTSVSSLLRATIAPSMPLNFDHNLENVAELIPCVPQGSGTGAPTSASFKTAMTFDVLASLRGLPKHRQY